MSRFKAPQQAASSQIPYTGPDTKFWFSSNIEDWMPNFREKREEYRERAIIRNTHRK